MTDAHVRSGGSGAPRCVVRRRDTAPQRQPRFHATPWGELRRERRWSLRELSRRTGLNIADLSRIDAGKQTITPDQAKAILIAYGLVRPIE